MRAVSFDRVGGPEELHIVDLPDPEPAPGEVQIAVRCAGVNFAEVMARRGDFPVPLPFVPGLEAAGTVTAVGDGVDERLLGRAVTALTAVGGYAEIVTVPATRVFLLDRPARTLQLEEAAGLPCAATTAYSIVAAVGSLRPGDSLLVHGAAGGVGLLASQVARHLGARRVVGVVGAAGAKARAAREHGAYDDIVPADGFAAAARRVNSGRGFDVVLDSVGGQARKENLTLLAPLGRLVVFGNATAADDDVVRLLGDLQAVNRTVAGYNVVDLADSDTTTFRSHAEAALDLVASGALIPHVTGVHPLSEVVAVHRKLEGRRTAGKLLLSVPG